jgi:membrane protein required for colicin V production
VAVAIVIMLIKIMFHRFIHSLGLGGLNYFIGALFGIARGLVISALIIVVVEMFTMDEKHSWQNSIISPLLVPTVNLIVNQFNSIKRIDFEAAHQANFFKNQASEILSK